MVSATEARVHFGDLLRRVNEGGEPVIVERGGRAMAVVLSMDAYERLVQQGGATQDAVLERIRRFREGLARRLDGRALDDPADVIRAAREARDAR